MSTALDLTKKPLPEPTAVSKPFWDGLRDREVRMQRCRACNRLQFYPRPSCHWCGVADLEWTVIEGRGTIYSFTVIHRAPYAAFADDVPYVYAVVELDPDVRVVTNIVTTGDPEALQIGDRVLARFDDEGDVTLLRFVPEADGVS
jgi:uncharacterized OB-fold protein